MAISSPFLIKVRILSRLTPRLAATVGTVKAERLGFAWFDTFLAPWGLFVTNH